MRATPSPKVFQVAHPRAVHTGAVGVVGGAVAGAVEGAAGVAHVWEARGHGVNTLGIDALQWATHVRYTAQSWPRDENMTKPANSSVFIDGYTSMHRQ